MCLFKKKAPKYLTDQLAEQCPYKVEAGDYYIEEALTEAVNNAIEKQENKGIPKEVVNSFKEG